MHNSMRWINFISTGMYNLNRLFVIFFVNLNKKKQAIIAHVAKK
jgi:hypothetical protein